MATLKNSLVKKNKLTVTKRTFLQTTSVLAAGALVSRLMSCNPKTKQPALKNWSGNLTYSTSNIYYPTTLQEVQYLVKQNKQLTVLGSQHSFNAIADNTHCLLSLKKLNQLVALDVTNHTVTVEGGMRYGDLAPYLHQQGYALHNLASLPHITIAGSCATATHGSGINNGNLATGITGIELVKASGEVIALSTKDGAQFFGAVVGLGALGVVTKVTLALVPTFNMRQWVYRNLPMDALKNNFIAIEALGYSVSLFTDWKNNNINEVWIKQKIADGDTEAPQELFGATLAKQNLHPIESESADNCTEQMGVAGHWFERMPHFKMGFKPSAGKELQSEYFVAIEHAVAVIMAIEKLKEKISPYLFISEIRTIAADELWMSPCYHKKSVAIHFTWKQDIDAVMGLLPLIETALSPFEARPHWGKLFTMSPSVLASRIEKLEDFKALMKQYDPTGKFRNQFIQQNLFA